MTELKVINDKKMHTFFSEWSKNLDMLALKSGIDLSVIHIDFFIPKNVDFNYETMQKNLHMVFGESSNIEEEICLFDDVMEFLQHVVQIDGADRLFSKHFYDIEWSMFLEADFEKSEMKIYRDHFVHQIRDAYLGYYLIWEIGLYKNIENAIHKYDSSGFSQFLNIFISKEPSCEKQKTMCKQIIWKTWFLAALFHDIGYPLAYHQRYSAKMDKYMPYLRVLDSRRQMDFVELSALLADTYLFKMVDYEELKLQYQKFDHGILSAICLLLNYYHTGAIHRLSNTDRCSIELAAYAIFVHTRKYSIQKREESNEKIELVRPVFVEDPISYILRLVDDLQEWNRVYFIVGENSNTLICKECLKLMKKVSKDIYRCECGKEFSKITSIDYRKINLVKVCNNLIIEDDGKTIIFELDYDLMKLLEILILDKNYAEYRMKELQNLRKILTDQALLPNMKIKYFLSNNFIEIKIEIIKEYIKKQIGNIEEVKDDYLLTNTNEIEEIINKEINKNLDEKIKESLRIEIESIITYLKNKKRNPICKEVPPKDYLDNIYLYKLIQKNTNG